MLNAVIIEDEIGSVNVLIQLLTDNNYVEVKVLGIADTIQGGLEMIVEKKPDVVFMDIELRDGSSFQILEQLEKIDFKLIFVTAFDKFALDAFRFSAMDYLLKPIDNALFNDILKKLATENKRQDTNKQYEFLKEIREHNVIEKVDKIALIDQEGMFFESLDNIVFFQAKSSYTEISTIDGKTYTMTKNLGYYGEMLAQHKNFYRIHYSTIININFIKKISKISANRTFQIELETKQNFTISQRRVAEFKKLVDM